MFAKTISLRDMYFPSPFFFPPFFSFLEEKDSSLVEGMDPYVGMSSFCINHELPLFLFAEGKIDALFFPFPQADERLSAC